MSWAAPLAGAGMLPQGLGGMSLPGAAVPGLAAMPMGLASSSGAAAQGALSGGGALAGGSLQAMLPGAAGMDAAQQMQLMQNMQLQAMMQQQMLQTGQSPQMLQQAAAMASQQFMQQAAVAYDQQEKPLEPELLDFQKEFKLDDKIVKDLDAQLKKRNCVEDDVKALSSIIEGARNPAGLLRVKIREMEDGTFRGAATPDADIEDMARKYKLDAQAAAKLSEVLSKRPDRRHDLKQINKHLELSNKPSSLVMLMLKDLRAGHPVKDPEYPAAVGSYRHRNGLRDLRGRKRSRSRSKKNKRAVPGQPKPAPPLGGGVTGPRTLLDRFG
eukprot:TRINITY_DN21542_c0_g1_i1.p1 TRINITY_DN21542_c0_g1~~TRINITY_DN21542_c0_g1_i1.p1  ORF type:complete len:327 (-),score=95.67 TRINITY_DN21542_c0_g1_i1:142-1122(-)